MLSPRSRASCCKAGPCISINERRVCRPARSRAVAAPIPLAAPVIRILLPLRSLALLDIGIPFLQFIHIFYAIQTLSGMEKSLKSRDEDRNVIYLLAMFFF